MYKILVINPCEQGRHYEAVEGEDRILIPQLPKLHGLRHRWCWEKRSRLHVPTWSYAKLPQGTHSPEENARLLCVYMRPWTLSKDVAHDDCPLLTDLGKNVSATAPDVSTGVTTSKDNNRLSYSAAWDWYIRGNVISRISCRYITNLLAASAISRAEEQEDSSDDSDADAWADALRNAGDMDLVKKTLNGIAANSKDDGAKGFGRHADTIRLGRNLWQSEALSQKEQEDVKETYYDEGQFPTAQECKKMLFAKAKEGEDRPLPFTGSTVPYAKSSIKEYSHKLEDWLKKVTKEKEPPTPEQLAILIDVKNRILREIRLDKIDNDAGQRDTAYDSEVEPMRGLIHGAPGTGKSRLIGFIRRLFEEGMEWRHGDQFLFIAVQNRVAYAMGGTTFHTGGDIPVGENCERKLSHLDVDPLYTRNQALRWILIDEVGMSPNTLLGTFDHHLTDAAKDTKYLRRSDKSTRPFGGYNLLLLGDFNQIPPIPPTTAVFIPPEQERPEGLAGKAIDLFWGSDVNSLNYFKELTIQKRTDDAWYDALLKECRKGSLSEESYNALHGLPTRQPGSWLGNVPCSNEKCKHLPEIWADMARRDVPWVEMQRMECVPCGKERERRTRLLAHDDPRVRQQPFVSAPYIHKNNQPKYHAMLLRAAEDAKRKRKYTLWFSATDEPENPAQVTKSPGKLAKRLEAFLQFHDQKTRGVPGLNLIYDDMPARVTERIVVQGKEIVILKHTPCTVVGWELHSMDRRCDTKASERYLTKMPVCIF